MNNIFLKILHEEKAQLLQKLSAIEKAISTYSDPALDNDISGKNNIYININTLLSNTGSGFFQKYSSYNIEASTKDKILFIIKTENRFLHAREIARIMQLLEEGEGMKSVIKKISPALSILKKTPDSFLVSFEAGGSHFNTFWGYKEWVSQDGNIDEPFRYNEAEITKRKRQISA